MASDKKTDAPASPTVASDLYPNDMGPDEVDVSEYPKPIREGYKLMRFKCAACHTPARPLNSQFLELSEQHEHQSLHLTLPWKAPGVGLFR